MGNDSRICSSCTRRDSEQWFRLGYVASLSYFLLRCKIHILCIKSDQSIATNVYVHKTYTLPRWKSVFSAPGVPASPLPISPPSSAPTPSLEYVFEVALEGLIPIGLDMGVCGKEKRSKMPKFLVSCLVAGGAICRPGASLGRGIN